MKEHPIIFSTDMVKAILENRKTQTRRVMRPQPLNVDESDGRQVVLIDRPRHDGEGLYVVPEDWHPYGVTGDRLWVRETFAMRGDIEPDTDRARHYLKYKTDPPSDLGMEWHPYGKWRPSIHMPRWASRVSVEILDVRVAWVQDITEEDALAEGVKASDAVIMFQVGKDLRPRAAPEMEGTARGAFAVLWDGINAKRGFGWGTNPFVWTLTFKKIEPVQ